MAALVIGRGAVDRIVSEAGILLAVEVATVTLSEGVPGVLADITARALVPAAVAVAPAWALEVEAEASEAVVGGVGKWRKLRGEKPEHLLCQRIEFSLGSSRS